MNPTHTGQLQTAALDPRSRIGRGLAMRAAEREAATACAAIRAPGPRALHIHPRPVGALWFPVTRAKGATTYYAVSTDGALALLRGGASANRAELADIHGRATAAPDAPVFEPGPADLAAMANRASASVALYDRAARCVTLVYDCGPIELTATAPALVCESRTIAHDAAVPGTDAVCAVIARYAADTGRRLVMPGTVREWSRLPLARVGEGPQ